MTPPINREIQPKSNKFDSIKLPKAEKLVLSNGIPVYILNLGKEDVLRMEVCIKAGSAYQDKSLVASTTMKMLQEGTQSFSSEVISETFDFYGASFEKEIEKDLINLKIYSLTKHLNKLFPIISELIFEPTFNKDELGKYLKKAKQKFQVQNSKAKYIARKNFFPLLFGKEHPYGFSAELEDFDNISIDDVKCFHEKNYNNEGIFILISGKVNDECIADLDKFFGQTKNELTKVKDISGFSIESIKERSNYIPRDNSVQNAFRIGKTLFNINHEDYIGLKVLNTVFGGYFGSRLMSNIREDKGYTYGIGSAIIPLHHSGYFFIASEVGTEVCADALKEVYFEMDRIQQEKIPQAELDLVKNYMLGSYLRSIDGPFSMMDRAKTIIEYQLAEDHFERYTEEIKEISAERLQMLAQKYFAKEELIELIVGKK